MRLDLFLARHFSDYSRGYWKGLIERGCVRVGGRGRPADYRLRADERVELLEPDSGWADLPFEDWVLFEDKALLVLDKPSGLLMHPVGASWIRSPRACLSEAEANVAGLLLRHRPDAAASGVSRCGLVHRLDRGTSGVLVVSKTPRVQERLQALFYERRVEKIYRAVVLGELDESVDVEAPLGRKPRRRRIEVTPWGREAATRFKVLGRAKGATMVSAEPLTGRTHQIRAHLAYIGHPVLGDPESGRVSPERLREKKIPPPPRLMLHAYSLVFAHPAGGRSVRFTVPPPKDFRDYWKSLVAS